MQMTTWATIRSFGVAMLTFFLFCLSYSRIAYVLYLNFVFVMCILIFPLYFAYQFNIKLLLRAGR